MATYYVDTAVGGDGNGGGAEGAGNAWATIDHAMNTVAANDKVYVKASGNYNELATIDTVGEAFAPIIFEGYTATPGDGGRAVVSGGAARANCIADSLGAGTDIFYVFKNFQFTNATGDNFATDCDHITFKNCKFDTSGNTGLACQLVACEACEFVSNTAHGVSITAGGGIFIGCTFYSNGFDGLQGGTFSVVALFCTFFSNARWNISINGVDKLLVIANCTIDGDNEDSDRGISLGDEEQCMTAVVNTVIYDCDAGMVSTDGDCGERVISRNNAVNSNSADYTNADTFTGEVTAAPAFVNEVAGADFTPDTGSPLIEAGYDIGGDAEIGAIQLPGGSAGGLLMPNKRGGKQ